MDARYRNAGYTGANPMPPGHGREQPLYGSYPYGDYIQGYPQGGYLPTAVPVPVEASGSEDRPEDYIPDVVKQYLAYFRAMVAQKNMAAILQLYEYEFQKLSSRWFREYPWPEAEKISDIVEHDELFLHLYRELYCRHIYAMHKPTVEQRIESYFMYCHLFDYFLRREDPLDLELPNQWLWDIIDEFLYQYMQFVQFRSKLKSRTAEEIKQLKENPGVWDIRSVLNILYSLVNRSAINEQLVVFQQGGDPATVAGPFGKCSLYKNLGYFSLIALLRLHCQLGDYYLAMEAVKNVQLSKKVLANTRVPASQISLHYHVGFCYLMTRRYNDTLRIFANIIVYIQKAREHFPPDSYQLKQVLKQNDQMLGLVGIVLALYPQHVDEAVNSQLKDKMSEKTAKLQKGDKKVFEEIFMNSCPKFLTPDMPDYEGLPENVGKDMIAQQCAVFMADIEQQLVLPNIRSYLRFYTAMPISKLAAFMEMNEERLRSVLLCYKHKTRTIQNLRPLGPVSGETLSQSEIDFYIDGDMVHIADTKVARRYGDFFIRQIHKLNASLGASASVSGSRPMLA